MRRTGMGKYLGAAAFIALVVAILLLDHRFDWSGMLVRGELFDRLRALLSSHPIEAMLMFAVVTVIGCVALALPVAVFAVAAGVLFGAFWGALLCWGSVTLGACLGFLVSRYCLKGWLKPILSRSERLNRIFFEGAKRREVYLLALTRLTPILPFNLQNFAYGVTDIGFAPYMLYSALFLIPGTAMCTVGSAGVVGAENRIACFAVAGALLVLSLAAALVLKRAEDAREARERAESAE